MRYKTIVLELLQEGPGLYDQLRSSNRLLPALESYATELKTAHEAWKEQIARLNPGSDPSQIAAEAMELAIESLQARLPSATPKAEAELISLDAAMAYLRRHTPPA
jgi:hypothetical protein